ncbi:sugar ABC transporter substrate-binding protein [Phycicoccus endophyticus]|uniref:ABC transporter substrate-binding protein n=1 Tax=Phycicoccus endophyticus TaxID=1690220 RepID=UPI00280BC8B9|nr:sugar ABC transporter substrate-binding protein [Phycicoccus endophyticus]
MGGLAVALVVTACSGAGGTRGGDDGAQALRVLMVNNPQMKTLEKLTPEFTKETGIEVAFTSLPENDVRDKVSQEYSSQAGQYDITSVSAFEVPIFAKNGWMQPLDDYVAQDPSYDQDDIFPAFTKGLSGPDGRLYAEPFYGESSFTMFRKDLLEKKGLTMPDNPTWDDIVDIAAKVNDVEPGVAGICLRGLAGWGQNLAALDTVINTYGGQWFDMGWDAKLDSPQVKSATQMYVDLLRESGEPGAAQTGVQECINIMLQGKAAIMYDATSIAGLLEAPDSPIKGKVGYVPAPVKKTDNSGWLWTWAWGIPKSSENAEAAWKFIRWATSSDYEKRVGDDPQYGWTVAPTGKRSSTYDQPGYIQAAAPYYKQEKAALDAADPTHPGVDPQPYTGIQFVGIAEFPDLGTQVGQAVADAIAGNITVDRALAKAQELAVPVGEKYQE